MRRRSNGRRYLAPLATFVLLAGPASAAETGAEPWMTDRYEVEIIIFRHLDQARNTPEQPAVAQIVAASLPSQYNESAEAPYVTDPNAADPVTDDRPRPPGVTFYLQDVHPEFPDYVPLADGKQMNRVYSRLGQLDAYAPMLHRAWIQAARSVDEAIPVYIRSDELCDFNVTGTINLFKGRYGPYVSDGDVNASLPRDMENPESLTVAHALELLAVQREKKGQEKKVKKKASKKAAQKKTSKKAPAAGASEDA